MSTTKPLSWLLMVGTAVLSTCGVRATVADAVRPAHVSLWVRTVQEAR